MYLPFGTHSIDSQFDKEAEDTSLISVLPGLEYGISCNFTVALQGLKNKSDQPVHINSVGMLPGFINNAANRLDTSRLL